MICFFNSCKEWGGGEKWHYEIAKELHREMEIIVLTNMKSELYKKCIEKGLKCIKINVTNISFLNIFKIIQLSVLLRKNKVETIIMNLPNDLKLAGIAAKIAGVKKRIYRRGSAIPIKNTLINRFLFKYIITEVIANSKETKRSILLKNNKIIDADKIKVVYNGLDCIEYEKREFSRIENKNGIFTIGNAGRLVEQKGQKYLIDLAYELKIKNKKFRIIIAGTGELENELKEYAALKGVSEYISFLGFKNNIKDVMESIDLFILTSKWEGFGYVLAEAMLSRKPIVAFDISSNAELVENGNNGFLITPFNIQEMAEATAKLMENEDVMKKMGQYGYEKVLKEFEIKRVYEEVRKII